MKKKICFVFISLIIEKYVRDTCIFPLPPTAPPAWVSGQSTFWTRSTRSQDAKKKKYFLPNFQLFKKNFIGESSPPPPFSRKAYWISLYPNLCCCLPLRCSGRAAWWASSAWSCSQSRPPAHWRTGVVHVRSTSTTF